MQTSACEFDSARRPPRPLEEFLELHEQQSVVLAFIERELKVRYKRSVLGFAWTMLNPLLFVVVLSLVFSGPFGAVAPAYPVLLLPGLLLWNFFSQSIMRVVAEVAAGVDMWRRVRVPRTSLAIAAVTSGLINLAFALVVVTSVVMIVRPVSVAAIATLPVTALLCAVFTLGVALLFASIALYFPDIADLLTMLLPALMFLTPVIYPRELLDPRIASVLQWNPLTIFVEAFRDPLYRGTVPSGKVFLVMLLIALTTFAGGWLAFTSRSEDAQIRG